MIARKGVQVIAIGALLSSLNLRVVLSVVEGETYVPASLLVETEGFLAVVQRADKIEQVVEWVEENF